MHKVKQYQKKKLTFFLPYTDCDVVAASRYLPLYNVILFPRRSCNNVKGKKPLFIE